MEQTKTATRMYSGNAPSTEWECVEVFNSDRLVWHLYRNEEVKDKWWNFKLVAALRAPGKANYWFGWNGRRTNNPRDWQILAANRPELHALVVKYLTECA